jgi:hypothetical protein
MFQKNLKKSISIILLAAMILVFTACSAPTGKQGGDSLYFYSKTAQDVAKWEPMVVPDGTPTGSVEMGDTAAIIKADPSGWGGVQSEKMTLDLSKHPMLLIRIRECHDGFYWGAKFIPSEPKIEEHQWGFYLFEDNNFKYNNYAGVDIRSKLGEEVIELYGEKIEGVIWIFACKSPESQVEVSEVKMFNQK